jgi:uncharacterized surface protein with fasciclin (FAS1) repeats
MKSNTLIMMIAVAFATILFTACSSGNSKAEAETTEEVVVEETPEVTPDVVDIAVGSPDHTTLVAAVTAAGLVETLKGAGPFTVFAPVNAAFDALPAGTVEGLLKPESKDALVGILTYHVVAGAVDAASLVDGQKVATLQGKELTVKIKDGIVTINGAKVIAADLMGSNGIVHVIDAVLLP